MTMETTKTTLLEPTNKDGSEDFAALLASLADVGKNGRPSKRLSPGASIIDSMRHQIQDPDLEGMRKKAKISTTKSPTEDEAASHQMENSPEEEVEADMPLIKEEEDQDYEESEANEMEEESTENGEMKQNGDVPPSEGHGYKRKRNGKMFSSKKKRDHSSPSPPHPSVNTVFETKKQNGPDGKMSFQEAAIKVLLEQRQKRKLRIVYSKDLGPHICCWSRRYQV
eukprot:TRINITY_DN10836_c0_g2_i1.p1 TRINITY_DN10836_c0_g2~~TRINITY_DN10836_c0_g2_i1.p1  ORF type:complete len:225 (+),score=56.96 TRINITY_DN10836_c0_g2_i1:286-960(+)